GEIVAAAEGDGRFVRYAGRTDCRVADGNALVAVLHRVARKGHLGAQAEIGGDQEAGRGVERINLAETSGDEIVDEGNLGATTGFGRVFEVVAWAFAGVVVALEQADDIRVAEMRADPTDIGEDGIEHINLGVAAHGYARAGRRAVDDVREMHLVYRTVAEMADGDHDLVAGAVDVELTEIAG